MAAQKSRCPIVIRAKGKKKGRRREIDQAWSIYGGSEEPMPEYNSGERKEERERREIDQAWSIYGGSKEPMPEYNSGEMNEEKRNERR